MRGKKEHNVLLPEHLCVSSVLCFKLPSGFCLSCLLFVFLFCRKVLPWQIG